MKYALACDTWDHNELEAIQSVIKSGRYTMGPHVKKFEKEFFTRGNEKKEIKIRCNNGFNYWKILIK